MKTIEVLYSCRKCGIINKGVRLEERGLCEDIGVWMNKLTYMLSRDHDLTSPKCKITALDEVKIPIPDGTTLVGRTPETEN